MLATVDRIIDSLFESRSINNPAVPLTSSRIIDYIGGAATTPSGMSVTNAKAMTYSPLWLGVDLISGDISTLRLLTFEIQGKTRRRAVEHSTYKLLRRFTGELTSNLWLQVMMSNALLYGNSYSRIHRDGFGQAERLEFIPSGNMRATDRDEKGRKRYHYVSREDGHTVLDVDDDSIFHLPGLLLHDLGGLSLIDYARNTIGRNLSAEQFTDEFFANGASNKGWLKFPSKFGSHEEKQEWARQFREQHVGVGNRHKIPILDSGMEWVDSGVNPHDALLLDMLSFGVKDVSRFFKLPPHKLGDDAKTSYNSIEQENLAYFQSTLLYWCTKIEFEANRKLLRADEYETHQVEFVVDTFLRADSRTRAETQNIRIMNGSLTRNEAREQDNQNPLDGLDKPLQPLNMTATGEEPNEPDTSSPVLLAARDLLAERLQVRMSAMVKDAARATSKPERFLMWVNDNSRRYGKSFEYEARGPARVVAAVTGCDEQALTAQIAEAVLKAGVDGLLTASEVSEDALESSVKDSMDRLTARCTELATRAILGGFEDDD